MREASWVQRQTNRRGELESEKGGENDKRTKKEAIETAQRHVLRKLYFIQRIISLQISFHPLQNDCVHNCFRLSDFGAGYYLVYVPLLSAFIRKSNFLSKLSLQTMYPIQFTFHVTPSFPFYFTLYFRSRCFNNICFIHLRVFGFDLLNFTFISTSMSCVMKLCIILSRILWNNNLILVVCFSFRVRMFAALFICVIIGEVIRGKF